MTAGVHIDIIPKAWEAHTFLSQKNKMNAHSESVKFNV